jgi:hypothetical protein
MTEDQTGVGGAEGDKVSPGPSNKELVDVEKAGGFEKVEEGLAGKAKAAAEARTDLPPNSGMMSPDSDN